METDYPIKNNCFSRSCLWSSKAWFSTKPEILYTYCSKICKDKVCTTIIQKDCHWSVRCSELEACSPEECDPYTSVYETSAFCLIGQTTKCLFNLLSQRADIFLTLMNKTIPWSWNYNPHSLPIIYFKIWFVNGGTFRIIVQEFKKTSNRWLAQRRGFCEALLGGHSSIGEFFFWEIPSSKTSTGWILNKIAQHTLLVGMCFFPGFAHGSFLGWDQGGVKRSDSEGWWTTGGCCWLVRNWKVVLFHRSLLQDKSQVYSTNY